MTYIVLKLGNTKERIVNPDCLTIALLNHIKEALGQDINPQALNLPVQLLSSAGIQQTTNSQNSTSNNAVTSSTVASSPQSNSPNTLSYSSTSNNLFMQLFVSNLSADQLDLATLEGEVLDLPARMRDSAKSFIEDRQSYYVVRAAEPEFTEEHGISYIAIYEGSEIDKIKFALPVSETTNNSNASRSKASRTSAYKFSGYNGNGGASAGNRTDSASRTGSGGPSSASTGNGHDGSASTDESGQARRRGTNAASMSSTDGKSHMKTPPPSNAKSSGSSSTATGAKKK